jgi:uncharacterized protein YcbK (DUF882 family)
MVKLTAKRRKIMSLNWNDYPNFSEKEFECRHCGQLKIVEKLVQLLQFIRNRYGKPIIITSGYRCAYHPVEKQKSKPGEHNLGAAVDILCYGENALELIRLAMVNQIKRIGVNQKGNINNRYIHLGIGDWISNDYQAGIWTY